ncbi:MAG: hypothetical protein GVY13_05865 [Alphaproteobacteria bacterium]|jgi:translocation and assembly module TamB|nr:hypothetical protein [Alphaproteobacteria bacterium]
MRKSRRWLWRLPLLIVLVPVLLLAVVIGVLNLPVAQRTAADLITDLAGGTVSVGGIDGFVPVDFSVTDLALSDADGVWLSVDRARLAWSPGALIGGRLEVAALTAGTVHVRRPPLPGPEPAPPEDPAAPFRPSDLALPELPVDVRLDRLAVEEIRLDAPVLGTAASFTLSAEARLPDAAGGLMARLNLERLDAPGTIALDLGFAPDTQQLALDLQVDEPAGGLVARTAALPGLPPVSVSLQGDGPVTDWRAALQARAGPELGAEGTIGLRETEAGLVLRPDLTARLAALTDDPLDPLVAGGIGLAGDITYGPAGEIGWQDLRLTAPAADIATSGSLDPDGERLSVDLRLEAGDAAVFAGLLPPGTGWSGLRLQAEAEGGMDDLTASVMLEAEGLAGPAEAGAGPTVDSLQLSLTAEGPALQPDLTAALTAEGLAAGPGIRMDGLRVDLAADPQGPLDRPDARVTIDLNAVTRAADLGDPALAPLLQPEIALAASGTIGLDGSAEPLSLTLTTPAAELTAEGTARNWGAEADAQAHLAVPQLRAFAGLAGQPLRGALQLDLDVTATEGTVTAGLEAVLRDAATGIAQADALLGDRTTLTTRVRAEPDGSVIVTGLVLEAAGTRLESDRIALTEALQAGVTIDLPDLSAIDPALAGSAGLLLRATGPLDDLTVHATLDASDLEAGGQSIPQATLQVSAADLAGTPQGEVSLTATWRDRPVSLDTAYTVLGGGVQLADLRLALADAEITGALTAGFDGTADGSVAATVPDLGTLGALADLPLQGTADLSLDLTVVDGRQDVSAVLSLSQAALPGSVSIADARLDARVRNALGTPELQAELDGQGVSAADMRLDSLAVTAEGTLESLSTTIRADGPELALDTAARLDLAGDAIRIAIARLSGRYQGEPLALAGPATVTLAGPAIVVEDLRLTARDGSVRVDGRYDPADYSLDVGIDSLPLALADLAAPELNLQGRLNGSLALRGSQAAPRASLDLRAADIGLTQLREQGFGPLDLAVGGQWEGGRARLDATLTLPDDSTLNADLGLPLRMGPGGVPAVPSNGRLDGDITGTLDLALLNNMLATTADRVAGRAAIDVALTGPIDAPQADGEIRLTDGLYENAQYGILLEDIGLVLTAEGSRRFTVTELIARTPGGGSLSGEGGIDIGAAEGMPIDVTLALDEAHLIESQMLSAILGGDLALTGDLTADAALEGTLTVEEAQFSIPRQMPSSVPTLDVREVNVPEDLAERRGDRDEGEEEPATAFSLALDITVNAPGQIFIRGRGADLELGGRLMVGGTADTPRITGQLGTRRGTLDLLGKRFVFEEGEVVFNGEAEINPTLDLRAVTETEDVTGGVQIAGRASNPELSFFSEPPYPEDEILARLLFGQSPTELSTAQAIELASAAAELAGVGGGGNIMARIRETLQLDRLEIQEAEGGETELSAGRYVSDDVFVGVEQNLSEGSSRVTVEVEVTPNISVETDVGSDSTGRVGVKFEWEY